MNMLDRGVLQLLPGDLQVQKKILKVFLSSSEEMVAMMEAGVENSDTTVVAHAAHTLKSSSAMVGAMELSRLCQKIEAVINHDGLSGLAVVVQETRQVREMVERECLSIINQ